MTTPCLVSSSAFSRRQRGMAMLQPSQLGPLALELTRYLQVLLDGADVQADHHDRDHQGGDPAEPKAAGCTGS